MSATTVNNINLGLNVSVAKNAGLTQQGLVPGLALLISGSMKPGTGAGLVGQIFQQQFMLATNSNSTLDLYAFGGVLDAGGDAYTLAQIKIFIVQNLGVIGAVVEADTLTIGAGGTTAAWTSLITPNTAGVIIPSGGFIAFGNPSANTGLVVGASTTNHTLKFTSGASNTDTITYNVISIG